MNKIREELTNRFQSIQSHELRQVIELLPKEDAETLIYILRWVIHHSFILLGKPYADKYCSLWTKTVTRAIYLSAS